jgi:hypothetical protein
VAELVLARVTGAVYVIACVDVQLTDPFTVNDPVPVDVKVTGFAIFSHRIVAHATGASILKV